MVHFEELGGRRMFHDQYLASRHSRRAHKLALTAKTAREHRPRMAHFVPRCRVSQSLVGARCLAELSPGNEDGRSAPHDSDAVRLRRYEMSKARTHDQTQWQP